MIKKVLLSACITLGGLGVAGIAQAGAVDLGWHVGANCTVHGNADGNHTNWDAYDKGGDDGNPSTCPLNAYETWHPGSSQAVGPAYNPITMADAWAIRTCWNYGAIQHNYPSYIGGRHTSSFRTNVDSGVYWARPGSGLSPIYNQAVPSGCPYGHFGAAVFF